MFYINSYNCVCCHNCADECPMQAIDYVGRKYQIDQNKCVQCGLCEKVCHTGSIHNSEDARVPITHDLLHLKADVVVVGGGTGLISAVRAAQEGKKVILIEKAEKLGGNTDYAHAYFPVYTNWHEKQGMPDVREEAIQYYLDATDHIMDPEVTRTAVYGCSQFFDWLCEFGTCEQVYRLVNLGDADAHGPIYGPGLLDFPNRIIDNLNCRDDAIGPGWGGTYIKYTMLDAIEKQGLDVEIRMSTAGRHLLTDESGAIRGILAEDNGGQLEIEAPVVILACGGFGKSDEKMQKYFGFFDDQDAAVLPHRFTVPTDTGDGIDMLQELGVEPDPFRMQIDVFGPKHHPFSNALADDALEPEMLQINLNGKRWADETLHLHGMTPFIGNQPQKVSYAVCDEALIKMIAERFVNNPAFANKANTYATWKEELEEELKYNLPVQKADTLEELAEKCGIPVEPFMETIRRYNGFCETGVDEDFGKAAEHLVPINMEKGPYYAIYGQRFCDIAAGGVTVNGKCECIRNDQSTIPGLYGVGDMTSAMMIRGRLAVVSELTWAVASAYTSAVNAVQYIDNLMK